MKYITLISAMVITLTVTSFKMYQPADEPAFRTGTYGVCNCDDQTATKVELTINDDLTFRYFNNSDRANVLDVKGSWSSKGNTIILENYTSDRAIHNKWEVDKNEKCLKSRKGLEFTRLCHIKSCN